ncbi:phosphatase PAP2 family protein [Phytohabitans kaempferiae]|uniref:Phosphatase PAP2 family protein n=1 Tax=Phytohabitans kaempferiae TaxID=1620943 RepID=A0ABV6LYE7_9ACTN
MTFPAAWLTLLGLAEAVCVVALWRFFVRGERGQLLDTVALEGNAIGQDRVDGLATTVLNAVSLASLAVATIVVAVIALARGRVLLTLVVTAFVATANVVTQVLKHGLYRPEFGIDPERAAAGNSFPSGHATVAMSVVIALVLVLPPRMRGVAAVVGAGYAAVAGIATMSLGWHRPSDVAGAMLVVGGCAALAGLLLVLAQGRDARVKSDDAHPLAVALLVITSVVLVAVSAAAFWWTDGVATTPVDEVGRRTLLTAYAGAAASIAGVTAGVTALTLAAVHRVVPWRTG